MDLRDVELATALRRVLYQSIPSYAFDPDMVDIAVNTSCYNNTVMKNRIQYLPVFGVPFPESTFMDFLDNFPDFAIDNKLDDSKHLRTWGSHLVMKASVRNEGSDVRKVTTDDCEFILDGSRLPESPYKSPLLVIRLRPGEEFQFSARSRLGIPLESPIFQSFENCWITPREDGTVRLNVEVLVAEFKDLEVLYRACVEVLRRKLERLALPHEKSGSFELNNDRFTVTGLIDWLLKNHPAVEYVAFDCPHLLENKSVLHWRASKPLHLVWQEVLGKLPKILHRKK